MKICSVYAFPAVPAAALPGELEQLQARSG